VTQELQGMQRQSKRLSRFTSVDTLIGSGFRVVVIMPSGIASAISRNGSTACQGIGFVKPRPKKANQTSTARIQRRRVVETKIKQEVSRMSAKNYWLAFGIGVSAGAAIALLYAPQTGVKTRRQLRKGAESAGDYLEDAGDYLKAQAEHFANEAQKAIKRSREQVEAAVDQAGDAVSSAVKSVQSLV
jgi:gas vesicle protein